MRAHSLLLVAAGSLALGCEAKPSSPKADAHADSVSASEQSEQAPQKGGETASAAPDCSPVQDTLTTKDPKVSLQLTIAGAIVPMKFEPDAVYEASALWAKSAAPSICAAVVQPPAVPAPALNLIAQLKIAKAPGLLIEARSLTMGKLDLADPAALGASSLLGAYLPAGETTPQRLVFTAGEVALNRVDGVKSRVVLNFASASGKLEPSGQAFSIHGKIEATVGGR